MKIELLSMWYNEAFLAPFFFKHYAFVDKIHLFLDTDTNDGTRKEIERAHSLYGNIEAYNFKFPDMMDDSIKICHFNDFYKTIKGGYVMLVDADEFIFYPPGYLDVHPNIIHFTKLWNVYRYHTDKDLDPNLPIAEQRRHGTSAFESQDIYTKPNIVQAGWNFLWTVGHHACWLMGKPVAWNEPHEKFPEGVSKEPPLTGAHWAMADPCFAIERRVKGRRDRQSKVNLEKGYTVQHHHVTEEVLKASLKYHANDPQVF
jgi:hypothetical protein